MPEVLIIPGHIKQARLALLGAGIPVSKDDPAFHALMFAAVAYEKTPQVNKAEMLRQECARTQQELEDVSSELLDERKKSERLAAELSEIRKAPAPVQPASVKASKEMANLLRTNASLRQQLEDHGVTASNGPAQARQKVLQNSIACLRRELQSRPTHADATIEPKWREEKRLRKGYQKHLRKIQQVLDNSALSPAEKLAQITTHTHFGLLVGPDDLEPAKQVA